MKDRLFKMTHVLCEAYEILESNAAMMKEALDTRYTSDNDMNRYRIISYKTSTDMACKQVYEVMIKLDALWSELDK